MNKDVVNDSLTWELMASIEFEELSNKKFLNKTDRNKCKLFAKILKESYIQARNETDKIEE